MKFDSHTKYPIELLSNRNRYKGDVLIKRLSTILRPIEPLLRICATLYGHMSFLNWLTQESSSKRHPDYKHFATRQQLWEFLVLSSSMQDVGFVFEFGVANGDGTRFWLERLNHISYHGFDCFTGMPEKYRQVPKGVFDLDGNPPDISDSRVSWHIGFVEDTVGGFEFPDTSSRFFIFDLDLYGPTNFVLSKVEQSLKFGDILYFDEAWDDAEGIIARDFFIKSNNVQLLGSATGCMALIILND